MASLIDLDPGTYQPHQIHGSDRLWAETNCYVDVLIELIHALGFDPVAALAFTVSIDFELDQWTFFKYRHGDLLDLYGMDVQELNPWRSLAGHVEQQVAGGRPVLVELDSFFLPDTHGTTYHAEHVKSTVAVVDIDVASRHMGYFHGAGYYHVDGQDFDDLYQTGGLVHERMLPPYIELVKLRARPTDIGEQALIERSLATFARELACLPEINPFESFHARFARDIEWLREANIEVFHGYSFATLRQYGACFELVATYLRWLAERGESPLAQAADRFMDISQTAKNFQFKLARAIARRKPLDLAPIVQMGEQWAAVTNDLSGRYR